MMARPWASNTFVAVGLAVFLLLAAATYIWLPAVIVDDQTFRSGSDDAVNREDARLEARNDVRTSGLALLTLVAVAAGGVLTLRTVRLTRDGQLADRFAKGSESLAKGDSAAELGGVHLLESVARASRAEHWAAVRLLNRHLRERAGTWELGAAQPSARREVPPIVDEIASALGRRRRRWDGSRRLELSGLDLRNVDFTGADLRRANLNGSNLSGAFLRGARLDRAEMKSAVLIEAHLEDAKLRHANLKDAVFDGARIGGADFRKSKRTRASFENSRGNAKGR